MELGVRDWMIIVGVLLIVAVLIDGFRRVRNERRGNIRVSLNKQFLNATADEVDHLSELPSGGARSATRPPTAPAAAGDDLYESRFPSKDLDLEQDVPMLMESVCAEPDDYYSVTADQTASAYEHDDSSASQLQSAARQTTPVSSDNDNSCVDAGVGSDDSSATNKASGHNSIAQNNIDRSIDADVSDVDHSDAEKRRLEQAAAEKRLAANVDDKEVVVINVVAKDEPFKGPDLLHILLACDVRFGEMSIFHRHEKANGNGAVQFSVANSVEPGVFDLDAIDDFTTPGVCFFMSVPGPEKVIDAFDCLVETAQCVVKNLNGELRDESRSVMTQQTLEHCRQRLCEFERRQLTQHA